MNERLEKKLKKILAKAGLDEDQIDGIVEEVESAVAEEVVPEEGNPDETTEVPPVEDEPVVTEPAPEEVPPEAAAEEVPPVEEVPPTDGNIAAALDELAAQEGAVPPESEVPPEAVPPQEVIPQADPTEIQKLSDDLAEAHKTIEGLVARIDSLEEALKASGVISNDSKVGDETPRITPNANQENNDAFDDILATINGK